MEKKYTLPKEFGQKWVDALRSGEYKQGTLVLRRKNPDGSYCYCGNGLAYQSNCYEFVSDTQILVNGKPRSGFVSYGILPIREALFDEIIVLNDKQDKSFPEIADWIELNCEFV